MWRALVGALIAITVAVVAAPSLAAERVALVIGNGEYTGRGLSPLPNPGNDARAMAEALRALDFMVMEHVDLTVDEMDDALEAFGRAADGADIGLVFFAGHGLQNEGENFFFPVDANPRRLSSLPREGVTLEQFMDELEGVENLKIAIFDACRDNALVEDLRRGEANPTRSAAITRGLGRPTFTTAESLIAFATAPEAVAEDGVGANSPFTNALVEHLGAPGKEIRLVFGSVRDSVIAATEGRQKPEIISALGGREYVLAPRDPSTADAEVPTPEPRLSTSKIIEAQRNLERLGFDPGPADGAPGKKTEEAIGAFQEASGIVITGLLDRRTLDALAIAVRFAPPAPDDDDAPPEPTTFAACPANFSGRIGDSRELTCLCTPQAMQGSLWGSDVYTSDSAICPAAVHAGVVTPDGGVVSLRGADGRASYAGIARNGVSSGAWGAYDSSFVFTSEAIVTDADAGPDQCPVNASHLRGAIRRVECACEPTQLTGSVWGVDIYTDDSSICNAALHAGVIDAAGGSVAFVTGPGRLVYRGGERNGVSSAGYGPWHGSFYFPDQAEEDLLARACPLSLEHLRGRAETIDCACASEQFVGRVWGSDVYTDDSSVCLAAVHAGVISAADGGVVRVSTAPGLAAYPGSVRNGVASQSYGGWGGSFVFDGPVSIDAVEACPATAEGLSAPGEQLACSCAADAPDGRVWGTDIYTNDSAICAAARHAGVVDADGGVVRLIAEPGLSGYRGSARNGVVTEAYGAWGRSFRFTSN